MAGRIASAAAVAASVIFSALSASPAALAASPQVGEPAPPLTAPTLSGEVFRVQEQRGKVVLVRFWATWCVPCREELPIIDAYYRRQHPQGLEMIAVSVDSPNDQPKVEAEMQHFTFPAAMANSAQFKGYGRIWRMPMTFVIDRRGVLRIDTGVGDPVQIDQQWLEKNVTPLLVDRSE
jgi:peroxiredoxin